MQIPGVDLLNDFSFFVFSFLIGFVVGIGVSAWWVLWKLGKAPGIKRIVPLLVGLLTAVVAAGDVGVSLAQTPEPITVPTDVIFSQTNSWIDQLAPITAIGVGIAIAIAVLGYVGKQILSAFKG